jgi:hypothetical protein
VRYNRVFVWFSAKIVIRVQALLDYKHWRQLEVRQKKREKREQESRPVMATIDKRLLDIPYDHSFVFLNLYCSLPAIKALMMCKLSPTFSLPFSLGLELLFTTRSTTTSFFVSIIDHHGSSLVRGFLRCYNTIGVLGTSASLEYKNIYTYGNRL